MHSHMHKCTHACTGPCVRAHHGRAACTRQVAGVYHHRIIDAVLDDVSTCRSVCDTRDGGCSAVPSKLWNRLVAATDRLFGGAHPEESYLRALMHAHACTCMHSCTQCILYAWHTQEEIRAWISHACQHGSSSPTGFVFSFRTVVSIRFLEMAGRHGDVARRRRQLGLTDATPITQRADNVAAADRLTDNCDNSEDCGCRAAKRPRTAEQHEPSPESAVDHNSSPSQRAAGVCRFLAGRPPVCERGINQIMLYHQQAG